MFFLSVFPAGAVWVAASGLVTSITGLTIALILLAIIGMVGGKILFGLRKRRKGGESINIRTRVSLAGELVRRGKVERVEFYESHVGQTSKSIVTLSEKNKAQQMLVFEGDLRNALPTGHQVEFTFRKASGYNVLLQVNQA